MRRALVSGALAVLGGGAVGVLVRVLSAGPTLPERAAAAMTVVLAVATVAGASTDAADRDLRGRLRVVAAVAGMAWASAAAAGVAAGGGPGALGGAVVPAALAAVALGLGAALRSLRVETGTAAFAAAALASVPAALIFVADPWIEWDGSTPESPRRAHAVLQASPLAAMTSHDGGLGPDWQRMPMLYDGPATGVPGLSLVGQFYGTTPPSPFAWSGIVLGIGAALVAASRRAR